MVGSGPHQAESMGSQREDHFVNLKRKKDRECKPPTLVRANPEMEATSLMRKIPRPYNWKLIIWRESCAMNSKSKLPPILTPPLTVKRIVVTNADQGLLLVSPSHMMRMSIMSAEIEIHPPKAWEMIQWVELSTKFPNHPTHVELREGCSLGSSLSTCSPYTTVEQTLWSMWATLTWKWLCTPRIRPWCAMCFPPV